MALGKKPYPKATLKKVIKAHSDHNLKKNADVTVRYDATSSRRVLSAISRQRLLLTLPDFPKLRAFHGDVGAQGVSPVQWTDRSQVGEGGCDSFKTIRREGVGG
jgi:hypothetical protein